MPTLGDPEFEAARVRSIPSYPVPRIDSPLANWLPATPSTSDRGVDLASEPPEPPTLTRPAPDRQDVWRELTLDEPGHEGRSDLDARVDDAADDEPPPQTRDASELAGRLAEASAEPLASATEKDMQDRLSLGDYTGALGVAERLLAADPAHPAAQAAAERCRDVLRKMYTARIGPLDRVPTVIVAREQMHWLSIDHRAGFVLSLIDGVSTVETLLDVSGMPELEALRILSELVQQRVIALE